MLRWFKLREAAFFLDGLDEVEYLKPRVYPSSLRRFAQSLLVSELLTGQRIYAFFPLPFDELIEGKSQQEILRSDRHHVCLFISSTLGDTNDGEVCGCGCGYDIGGTIIVGTTRVMGIVS
jgi:hypothetical protein